MSKLRKKFRVLVVHGPNLNLLGTREPEIYGKLTLAEINGRLKKAVAGLPVTLQFFQSNSEGALIDFLHANRRKAQGLVINPAAYTHYAYALRDAIAAIDLPAVEVHLSDIKKREPFRRNSVIAPVCRKQISGRGWESYLEGVKFLAKLLGGGVRA